MNSILSRMNSLETACAAIAMSVVLSLGCNLEDQVKKSPNNIVGKKTQEIGEFKPAENAPVSDSKVRIDNPITGPLQAYGPMVEQIAKLGIQQAVDLFHATEGRYPNSYDEFMQRIIRENNIRLPVLPAGAQYQYDVENHKLVIVPATVPAADAAPGAPAGAGAEADAAPAAEPPATAPSP